jgi:hypothetical protein
MAATRLFTKSAIRPVDVLVKLHKFKVRPQDERFRAPIHNSGFCSMVGVHLADWLTQSDPSNPGCIRQL